MPGQLDLLSLAQMARYQNLSMIPNLMVKKKKKKKKKKIHALTILIGAKIPWGIGKMAMGSSKSTATFSMNPAMASAAEKNAAVVIAVSKATASASANLPSMFTSAMFLIGSLILIL
jgi:hypothetical protein